jgi:hypothetical protein
MKNLHLIPTDKPSRLWTNNLRRRLEIDEFPEQHPTNIAKQIFITSNEEIKEGDWVIKISSLYKGGGIAQKYSFIDAQFEDIIFKKIILTTDADLIQDGIQAIDDEFLQWFVKNPSCEYIETEYWCKACDITQEMSFGKCHESHKHCSCIVRVATDNYEIPKEEPKCTCKEHDPYCCQVHGSCPTCVKQEEPKQDYSGVHIKHCYQGEYEDGCKYGEDNCPAKPKEKPKQETLEKGVDKYFKLSHSRLKNEQQKEYERELFIAGAKWQAERMYSEEELICFAEWRDKYIDDLLINRNTTKELLHIWFEQFKNK